MKKKTIKSYFFKVFFKNPSTESMFCFSKRSLKQKKNTKLNVYKNVSERDIFYNDSAKNIKNYKFYITHNIKYNQWNLNKRKLKSLYLCSFFKKTISHTNFNITLTSFKTYIYLWYLLKIKFYSNSRKKINKYPDTGILSSHFVHFLSKKNITYQTRSKYRAKIINLNQLYFYTYLYTYLTHLYASILNYKLFFFTENLTKKNIYIDENFGINISSWNTDNLITKNGRFNCAIFKPNKLTSTLNVIDYNFDDYNYVLYHSNQIVQYLSETDVYKKDNYQTLIKNMDIKLIDLLPLAFKFSNYLNKYKNSSNYIFIVHATNLYSII